uniref:C-type lectin domain-containing protein n=1 Tax=Sinocyclocheilus grahami TaxID=75366 RepID=A0A672LJ16_SINGR
MNVQYTFNQCSECENLNMGKKPLDFLAPDNETTSCVSLFKNKIHFLRDHSSSVHIYYRIKSYKNTAEEFNQTINSLQDNHTDLTIKKSQLQDNFNSLSQKNLELESQVRSLSDQLKKESKRGQICCFWSSSLLMHVYSFLKCLCKNLCGLDGFFLSNEFKSWSDSRQYCRDHGADLVIINSGEKQRNHTYSCLVWIGLSDRQQEGNMKWVDNSPLKQGFWLKGEPNDQGGDEDCIELMPSNPVLNNWNDLSCSEKRKGICQK